MRLAVLKERRPDETRVSATPETVKKYKALGLDVAVEAGAGLSAGITDAAFAEAGAEVAPDAAAALNGAGIVLKVRAPMAAGEGGPDEMSHAAARGAAARPARHGGGGRLRRARRGCRRDGAAAAHHARAVHGHPLLAGEPRGLPRGDRGGGDLRPRLPDADDRGGHGAGGERLRHGRRRRGPAGHRHGAAARRARVGDRRAAGGQGGDQVARRRLHRPRGRGKPRRADGGRLRQADERRLPRQAGRGGGGGHQEVRHRGLHRAGAGPQGADPGLRADGARA